MNNRNRSARHRGVAKMFEQNGNKLFTFFFREQNAAALICAVFILATIAHKSASNHECQSPFILLHGEAPEKAIASRPPINKTIHVQRRMHGISSDSVCNHQYGKCIFEQRLAYGPYPSI